MIIKKQECQQEQPKRYAVEVLVKKIPNSQEVFFFKLLFLSLSSLPAHNVLFLIYFDVFLLETFLICILFKGFHLRIGLNLLKSTLFRSYCTLV